MIKFIRENQRFYLNFFDNLKFDRKADIVMHSRSMRCVWNLPRSLARALENLERIYMLDSNNKSDKLHEVARLELYRDSLKHEFLLVFQGALFWLLVVFAFQIFAEIILSLKNCSQLTRHGLYLKNKIIVDSSMVHLDSMQVWGDMVKNLN